MSIFTALFRRAPERPPAAPPLRPEAAWQLLPKCDWPTFLRALPLLALADGVVAFEGTTERRIAKWLAENATTDGLSISPGTLWPASDWWYLPINGRLPQFAEQLEHAASVSIHLYVYDRAGLVIEWYDAFDDPLWIARRVGDGPLAAFIAAVGGQLESVPPAV